MLGLKKSKIASILVGLYLLISFIAFMSHIISVNTNPGDSGLSALWFYFCALPWMEIVLKNVPQDFFYTEFWALINYGVGWLCVFLNAFILYCLCGGLRWGQKKES